MHKTCFFIAPIGSPNSSIREHSDQVLQFVVRAALSSLITESRFVTGSVALIDTITGDVELFNAAGTGLIRRSNGSCEIFPPGSIPLGIEADAPESKCYWRTQLDRGDAIVMFTDGLFKAMNDKREMLGREAVDRTISAARSNASAIGEQLLGLLRDWIGAEGRSDDDIKVACLSREP